VLYSSVLCRVAWPRPVGLSGERGVLVGPVRVQGPVPACQLAQRTESIPTVCWWPCAGPQHWNGLQDSRLTAPNNGKLQPSLLPHQRNARSLPSAIRLPSLLPRLLMSPLPASRVPPDASPQTPGIRSGTCSCSQGLAQHGWAAASACPSQPRTLWAPACEARGCSKLAATKTSLGVFAFIWKEPE